MGSGSGESGTIRAFDHLGQRRGLKTLLRSHMGKFGSDSTFGTIEAEEYVTSGSFVKQHRNISKKLIFSGSTIITGSTFDNGFISSPIPRSEFQYSWINAAVSGSQGWESKQRILGYAPRSGEVSSSVGGGLLGTTINPFDGDVLSVDKEINGSPEAGRRLASVVSNIDAGVQNAKSNGAGVQSAISFPLISEIFQ